MKTLIQQEHLIISGPCSAESKQQLREAASRLKASGKVDVFRAGIWKPRTNPGGYDGAGTTALPWMKDIKEEFALPIATEVATPKHVEEVLKYGFDLLWVGARTTVNPFAMQELAEALRGTDIPIYVKNPVNPDIKLWIGALERLKKVGVANIGCIHRGFSTYGETRYRNAPIWEIPIEMKRLFPEIPMLGDPSHIAGKRELLAEVAQRCVHMDYQGLMIESHPNPSEALTDKEQQITASELNMLLFSINWKQRDNAQLDFQEELNHLRTQIDLRDKDLIRILAERMSVVESIGKLKKTHNVAVLQSNRWNDMLEKLLNFSASLDLNTAFVRHLLEQLHLESIRVQTSLYESSTTSEATTVKNDAINV